MTRYYKLIMAIMALCVSIFFSACEEDPNEIVSDYSTVSLTLSSPTYGIDEIKLYSKPRSVKNDNFNWQNWIGSNCLVYIRDLYCNDKTYTARIKIYIRLKDQLFEVNNKYLLDSNDIAITLYNNKTGEEIVFDEVSDGYIYITEYETHNLGKASGNFEIRYSDNTIVSNGSFQGIQVNMEHNYSYTPLKSNLIYE